MVSVCNTESQLMLPSILCKTFQFLFLLSILPIVNTQNIAQRGQSCGNQGNYTANSTYETNLNILLQSLSSNASVTALNNATTGNTPDRIYGLLLCRGDVSTDECKNCAETASEEILQLCPYSNVAYIWYPSCFLRYSNIRFFSTMETTPDFYLWNVRNVSDPNEFNRLLGEFLNNITSEAALRSPRLFAVREAIFSSFQTIYGLAQCTTDISRTDCWTCLKNLTSLIPNTELNGKQGGRILGPSCNFRYEMYTFYNATATAPPPPPPPPPLPAPPPPPSPARSAPPSRSATTGESN